MAAVVAAATNIRTRRAIERQHQIFNGPKQAQEEARHRTKRLQRASLQATQEHLRRLEDQETRRQSLAATIRTLRIGQILALASRDSGNNGIFTEGDAGIGRIIVPGWIEILWPNRTRTRTTWPNVSWYVGQPITAAEVAEGAWAERLLALAPSEPSTCDEASCSDISEITAFLEEDLWSDGPGSASEVQILLDQDLALSTTSLGQCMA